MLLIGAMPNSYTFPFLSKSCAKAGLPHEGKQNHSHVLKLGLEPDAFVHTSLVNMYAAANWTVLIRCSRKAHTEMLCLIRRF